MLEVIEFILGLFALIAVFGFIRFLSDKAAGGLGQMAIAPQPCPRCQSSRVTVYSPYYPQRSSRFAVRCKDCNAEGSSAANAYSAILFWNQSLPRVR